MGEVRRYAAPDLPRAEGKLREELPELLARGLRPTWRVWLSAEVGRRRDGQGELVVQFARGPAVRETLPVDARYGVLALAVRLRELVRLQREALRDMAGMEAEVPRASGGQRRLLAQRLQRLERAVQEVDRELDRLQRLPR